MQTPDQGGDIIQLAYAQRYIQEMREYQKHKEEVKRDRLRLAELEVEQALSQARIKSLEDLVLKLTFQVENLIMDVETARWINHHFADRTGVGFDEPAHKSLVNLASVHMTSRRGLKKIGVN
jgi:hypothetical protein